MALLVWRKRVEREGGGRARISHTRLAFLGIHPGLLCPFLSVATAPFSKPESSPLSATSFFGDISMPHLHCPETLARAGYH